MAEGHLYFDQSQRNAYVGGAVAELTEPLKPGDMIGLVGRFPKLFSLPVDSKDLNFQRLTVDYTDHLEQHNLLQSIEAPPSVARPIIVQNTPQFADCVFVQDPRD